MNQLSPGAIRSHHTVCFITLAAVTMFAAPHGSSSPLDALYVCPTFEQEAVLENPCELRVGLDRVSKLHIMHSELDQERGCLVNRYTSTDIFAFCDRAYLPGTRWACDDVLTSYIHEATGRCVIFPSDCGEGRQARKEGWSASYDFCGQAPICPDGHEEQIPW